jgi:hypothetical protein
MALLHSIMNVCNHASKNNSFMIKMFMNFKKIVTLISIGLSTMPLYPKSLTYSSSFFSKTQSIEIRNNDNKLKLNLIKTNLYISSLNVEYDNFLFKKGKVCNTKNLESDFKSDAYVSYKWNNFEWYSNLPSICDNDFSINGFKWNNVNLKLDFSTFQSIDNTDEIYLKSFFIQPKSIKELKKGYISIIDYQSNVLDIRYEMVNTLLGIYYSSYVAVGKKELKFYFERQNLNYLYHIGFDFNLNHQQLSYSEYFYPQSSFSGKGAKRIYELESTIYKSINKDFLKFYKIKSLRIKLLEKIEIGEDLKSERTYSYYTKIYFSKLNKYNFDIRCGIKNKDPILEVTINNLKIGYNSKGLYNSLDLKFPKKIISLNINYIFKKKFDLKFIYNF